MGMFHHQTHFSTWEFGIFYPWHFLSLEEFIPSDTWHFLSQEYSITGTFYHGNTLSLEEFITGTFYPWKTLSWEEFITGSFYHPGSLAHFISQSFWHLLGQDGNLPVYVIFDFDLRCSIEAQSASSTLDQSINKAEESTFSYRAFVLFIQGK